MKIFSFLTLLILLKTILMNVSFAGEMIVCQTPNQEKVFKIEDQKIAFLDNVEFQQAFREIASLEFKNKISKTLNIEGQKYRINIKNIKKFDAFEDFLSIQNQRGHKLTYPLTCANF